MSTLREQVAQRIAADNPGFLVWDYPDVPNNVKAGRPVVAVWRGSMKAHEKTELALGHSIRINIYGAKTAGSEAELELDNHLDAVMFALQKMAGLKFEAAERTSFRDGTIAGYELTFSGTSKNVYRTANIGG